MNLYSEICEQSIIGSILINDDAYDAVAAELKSEMFYFPNYGLMYAGIQRLADQGTPIDFATLSADLEAHGQDLTDELLDLFNNTPSAANVTAYRDNVVKLARQRSELVAAQRITEILTSDRVDPNDRENAIQAVKSEVEDQEENKKTVLTGMEASKLFVDDIQHRMDNPDEKGIMFGIKAIDERMGGLQDGEVVVIPARPSMGKTLVATNLVSNACISGKRGMFFSLEMPSNQIYRRIIAQLGRISLSKLKNPETMNSEDWDKFQIAVRRSHQMNWVIDDQAGTDISEIRRRARYEQRKNGLDFAIIDYLQLITDATKKESRNQEVSSVSRWLKVMAKELNIPIVALAQLNRDLEKRNDKRPLPSDLGESGQIERDADIILFPYRDEVYNEDTPDKGIIEFIFGKFRDGEKGTERARFIGSQSRIEDLQWETN